MTISWAVIPSPEQKANQPPAGEPESTPSEKKVESSSEMNAEWKPNIKAEIKSEMKAESPSRNLSEEEDLPSMSVRTLLEGLKGEMLIEMRSRVDKAKVSEDKKKQA